MSYEHLKFPILKVIELLVSHKYVELEALTKGVRLDQKAIAKVIADYGQELVLPPSEAFDLMDVVAVQAESPRSWSAIMPLWTKAEGRSDLSIELTIIDSKEGFRIELDDIRVL